MTKRRDNFKKRDEFQNSPDNRRYDIVNVTIVHVEKRWCIAVTWELF